MFRFQKLNSRGQGSLEVLIIMGVLIIAAIIFSLIYIENLKTKDAANQAQDTSISDFNSTMYTYETLAQSGFNFKLESDFTSYLFFVLFFLIIELIQLSPFFKIINQKLI